jgi:hypothetical protein
MSDFVPCKDPNQYGVCERCRAELRALTYVIEGESEEDRPHPTPDDHHERASGSGLLCGGDHCLHPPSRRYLCVRQNPEYGDQELQDGTYDEIVVWAAEIILGEGGSVARLAYDLWRRQETLPDAPWNVVRWYDEAGEAVRGTFTIYPLAGEPERIG